MTFPLTAMPTTNRSLLPNGKGDLAVMSMETYEEMVGRIELYSKLQEGLADVEAGNTRPLPMLWLICATAGSADEI